MEYPNNVIVDHKGTKEQCYDSNFADAAIEQVRALVNSDHIKDCRIEINYNDCKVTIKHYTKDPELQHDYRTRACSIKNIGEYLNTHGIRGIDTATLKNWGEVLKQHAEWLLIHKAAMK